MRRCLLPIIATCLSAADWTWPQVTPSDVGFDATKLEAWKEALAARKTSGLLVIRRSAIAFEWYSASAGPDKPHGTASMAKALVGGMSLLVAMNDGTISADDLASRFIPAWKSDPRKSRITIRHLATHTSGIEDAEQDGLPHDKLPGWKGAFWKRTPDPFSIALRDAPVLFEPGTANGYSNPGMAALAYAVTASLKHAPQKDIRSLLKVRVMDPLGIPAEAWSIGYGRAYEVDGLSLYANWGGGSYTARAAARVGQLMLARGQWQGRQLIRRESVERAITYAGLPKPKRDEGDPAPAAGLAWHTNADVVWPDVPKDAFGGSGAGHQMMIVMPGLDLIVVRNGEYLGDIRKGYWRPMYEFVLRPLVAAITKP